MQRGATSRDVEARRACAGTRTARRTARSRTAASRGPAACRRSAADCARPGARTGSRRSPSVPDRTRRAPPAARSRAGRPPPRTRTADSRAASWRRRSRSSRSKRPLASTASCALPPSSCSTASMRGAVLGDRLADLHLHDRVAAVEIAAHLGAQLRDALARIVVAARRIDEDARVRLALVALGEQAEQRLAGDLCHRVPDRHVDRADRDRALAVPARLLVRHQRGPDAVRVEIVAGIVEQRLRLGLHQPRREALADQPALPVAAVRVEAVADDACGRRASRRSRPRPATASFSRSRYRRWRSTRRSARSLRGYRRCA